MSKYIVNQKGAVLDLASNSGLKLFVTSDVHFDSLHCNRELFFNDMERAIKNNCKVLIVGDFFDAMQGRFDPRRDMESVRPEYRFEEYYDKIVEDAIKQMKPYAEHILMITDGNHELSVLKNANTDITGRLVKGLNTKKTPVYRGGYGGAVLFREKNIVVPMKYFHGSGGEAPVTRGAIQTSRQAVFLADYQVVLNGHSHHAYWIPIVRERITNDAVHYFDIQHHVRTPGYNMSYGDGTKGWEVTRGGIPKPLGSCELNIEGGEVFFIPRIHAPIPTYIPADLYTGKEYPQE